MTPKTLTTNSDLLAGSLTDNINNQLTQVLHYMYYLLYFYNKVS